MELTIVQLCALLAITFITIGLLHFRAARRSPLSPANDTAGDSQLKLIDMQRCIEWQEYELQDLRDTIRNEALDHAEVERGLLQLLAAAAPLTDEDQASLEAIASKLELAADTFAAMPQTEDHSRQARQLATYAQHMAKRLEAARLNARPHPDSELMDWLSEHCTCWSNGERSEIRIPTISSDREHSGLRDLLRTSITLQESAAANEPERLDTMAA